MIKKFICMLSVVLFTCSMALAQDLNVKTTVDHVLGRDVHIENADLDAEISLTRAYLSTDVKLGEIFKLIPKIGVVDLSLETQSIGSLGKIEIESDTALNYGIGFELNVAKNIKETGIDLVLNGQYNRANLSIDTVEANGVKIDFPLKSDNILIDYSVGLTASKQVGTLVPYVGVRYSDTRIDHEIELPGITLTEDVESRDNVGLVLGVSGQINDNVSINLGGRLIDETAINASLKYSF